MKFMLLVYNDENAYSPDERDACMRESSALCHELHAKGQFIAASPLDSVRVARSVQVREGKRLVTDGPFAETTEQLGGYYLIDVPTIEDALEIASRIPPAKKGTIEVRPLGFLPGGVENPQ